MTETEKEKERHSMDPIEGQHMDMFSRFDQWFRSWQLAFFNSRNSNEEVEESEKLKVKIKSITSFGEVELEFSKNMNTPHFEIITNSTVNITIDPSEDTAHSEYLWSEHAQ